jgi:hypothetical protein
MQQEYSEAKSREINIKCDDSKYLLTALWNKWAASVVKWSKYPATDPEVPGSIPGPTGFSEK